MASRRCGPAGGDSAIGGPEPAELFAGVGDQPPYAAAVGAGSPPPGRAGSFAPSAGLPASLAASQIGGVSRGSLQTAHRKYAVCS